MNKTQLELLVDKLTKENRALEDNVIRLFKNVSTLENTVSTLEKTNSELDNLTDRLQSSNIYFLEIEEMLRNEILRIKDDYEDSLLNIELLNKEIATLQENNLDNLYLASLDEIQILNLKILKLKKKNKKLKK